MVDRCLLARPVLEVAPRLLGCLIVAEDAAGLVALRLTEVEAYAGQRDPGSHAFRGRTRRNAVMFGPPGHVYVYFTYGMHWCMNLVCEPDGTAAAVLLRAGEVVVGESVARARRGAHVAFRDLARGPARLTGALGVTGAANGLDALDPGSPLRLHSPVGGPPVAAAAGGRYAAAGSPAETPLAPTTGKSSQAGSAKTGTAQPGTAKTGAGPAGTAPGGTTDARTAEATTGHIQTGPRVGVGGAGSAVPWRFWLNGEPTVSAYRPAVPRRRDSRI